jgi:hypothetical protein
MRGQFRGGGEMRGHCKRWENEGAVADHGGNDDILYHL